MSQTGAFDFDTLVDRTGTASYKWDRYGDRDVIPLWVADMDFRAPAPVMDALHRRVEHGIFGYAHAPDGLVTAVRASLLEQYGWSVDPSWIVWLPGVVSGLNVLCRAVGAAGDEVITFTPVYPPFMSAPSYSERVTVRVALEEVGDRWAIDEAALARAITPRTCLLLICSPHNPVSRVWASDELSFLAGVAERHDLVLGSDEIHAGLILDEDKTHIPLASLSAATAARTVTLMAPSKTFNIPGLSCSFAVISDPRLRAKFCRAMEGIVPHVNTLGYVAAQAVYEQGEPWRRALIAYLRGNRDLVEERLSRLPGLKVTHVEATYLALIDTRATGIADPVRFFEDAGIGLSDGADFDAPGFVRLNFGCPRPLLNKALERMEKALTRRAEAARDEAPHG